jgi:hypothetical protein
VNDNVLFQLNLKISFLLIMFSLSRYGLAGEEEYSPADSFHYDLDIPDFHPAD